MQFGSVVLPARATLVLGALAALALAVAIPAGADAKGFSKCDWQRGEKLAVKKISCKKADKKVASKVINSFFGGRGVKWGSTCSDGIDPTRTCKYKVSKFKCTGKSRGSEGTIFVSKCKKGKQRVNYTIDRRDYG